MKLTRGIKIVSLVALAASTITIATGATIERSVRARMHNEGKVPGRLVDVGGGRRIQIDCRGSGSPTVVLESGLDNYGSLAWAAVHDSIAESTRACAYSRAGIMWSDPSGGDFDSRNAARDLRAALAASGESAPWVMVGHSIGAAYVMTFTQLFAAEVSGVVLVDGSHPDQFARFREATGRSLEPSATVPRIGAALAWTGLVRALPSGPTPASWPAEIGDVTPAFLPTSLGALAREAQAIPATLARAGEARSFGDRPLIALTAAQPQSPADLAAMGLSAEQGRRLQAVSRALHDDQATWSRRGRNDVVPNASHYIQFDRPEVVTAAIREVVGAITARAVFAVGLTDAGSDNSRNAAGWCAAERTRFGVSSARPDGAGRTRWISLTHSATRAFTTRIDLHDDRLFAERSIGFGGTTFDLVAEVSRGLVKRHATREAHREP